MKIHKRMAEINERWLVLTFSLGSSLPAKATKSVVFSELGVPRSKVILQNCPSKWEQNFHKRKLKLVFSSFRSRKKHESRISSIRFRYDNPINMLKTSILQLQLSRNVTVFSRDFDIVTLHGNACIEHRNKLFDKTKSDMAMTYLLG